MEKRKDVRGDASYVSDMGRRGTIGVTSAMVAVPPFDSHNDIWGVDYMNVGDRDG